MKGKSPIAWASIDFLCCLLLVVYTLIAPPVKPSSIDTLGLYAVVITWPKGSNDDVDLWVRDPRGNLVWFGVHDAGYMHLEHDDLGSIKNGTTQNGERVIIQRTIPGEYIANAQMYGKESRGPTPVTFTLWRLSGDDKVLVSRTVVLSEQGQETTGFRFNDHGKKTSELPFKFIGGIG